MNTWHLFHLKDTTKISYLLNKQYNDPVPDVKLVCKGSGAPHQWEVMSGASSTPVTHSSMMVLAMAFSLFVCPSAR